jgi:hypothetical protein
MPGRTASMIDKPGLADAVKSPVPTAQRRGRKIGRQSTATQNVLDCSPREQPARSEREHHQAQLKTDVGAHNKLVLKPILMSALRPTLTPFTIISEFPRVMAADHRGPVVMLGYPE